MDITKLFKIVVRELEGGEIRTYYRCTILEVELTHNGLPLDFAEVAFVTRDISLKTGSRFSRSGCNGKVTFSTPGIAGSISLTLPEIDTLDELDNRNEGTPNTGCFSTVLVAFLGIAGILWLLYYLQ